MSKNFFHTPTLFFIVKELCLLLFSTSLHFLNNFKNISHIEILKVRECNKCINLLFYKILVYQILRFVSPYQEFAIENLKKRHCIFLVLEGLNTIIVKMKYERNHSYFFTSFKLIFQHLD